MRWILYLTSLVLVLGAAGAVAVGWGFVRYGQGLPDYKRLADYQPPVVTRVHAGDGSLLAEYASQRRIFVPVSAMPRHVINAFLAAEDKNFYSHHGIDFPSLAVAAVTNLWTVGTNRRPRGASTITQQVAKNFLLTNEASLERKIKEAILALRIERALSKDRILELYLNEIYLGFGSYGAAAAALNYFDKSLDELTLEDSAFLAALPKAPNNYHPIRKHLAAVNRRNWVIGQMLANDFVTEAAAQVARAAPLVIRPRSSIDFVDAPYFAEEVRRQLIDRYGASGVYGGGLSVRTTLAPRLQTIAREALQYGLMHYDRRHGWRGPVARWTVEPGWQHRLGATGRPDGMPDAWHIALVLSVDKTQAVIGFVDDRRGTIPLSELGWARAWKERQRLGGKIRTATSVLAPGDIVYVEPVGVDANNAPYPADTYALRQIPNVGGAIIALDPHTGRILAMSGGWDYALSQFNRATQAVRQPGSVFKPFVYIAALEQGLTPATRILDAPFVIDQGPGLGKWKPANYTKKFYGLSTMRLGIEKSRNLMTVRLAREIGMDRVGEYARRFGIVDTMPPHLSMALGAVETTLMRLTAGYGMLVNGGKRITPTLIDRIQDRNGRTVFRHDQRPCPGCRRGTWTGGSVPWLQDIREQIADPASAYQIVRMLEGVVQRGTGRRIASLDRPLAGKTGTTNDNVDSWFIGFAPDLVVGVFVGFDRPRTLGPHDTGSSVAVPIFKRFMVRALAGEPEVPFRTPAGVLHVRINAETGALAQAGDEKVIVEPFKPGTAPASASQVIDGTPGRGRRPGDGLPPVLAGSTDGLY